MRGHRSLSTVEAEVLRWCVEEEEEEGGRGEEKRRREGEERIYSASLRRVLWMLCAVCVCALVLCAVCMVCVVWCAWCRILIQT